MSWSYAWRNPISSRGPAALRRGVISGACVEITIFRRKSQFIDTLYNYYRYNGGRAPRKLTVVVR